MWASSVVMCLFVVCCDVLTVCIYTSQPKDSLFRGYRMAQVAVMMYGGPSTIKQQALYRDWPAGIFALLLGTQTVSASIFWGRFIARQRAVRRSPDFELGGMTSPQHSTRSHAAPVDDDEPVGGDGGNEQGDEDGTTDRQLWPRSLADASEARAAQSSTAGCAQPTDSGKSQNGDQSPKKESDESGQGGQSSSSADSRVEQCVSFWTAAGSAALLLGMALGLCIRSYVRSDFDGIELWFGALLSAPFALLRWRLTNLNSLPNRAPLLASACQARLECVS